MRSFRAGRWKENSMKTRVSHRIAAAAAMIIVASGTTALAMGGGGGASSSASSASTQDSDYTAAEQAVKAGRYADALPLLNKVVQRTPNNADAWNYIGFSNRKLGKFPEALAAYEKALAINPDHLGANEYLGELYLQTGDMPKAEARLAKLDKLCLFGCPEYRALKAAVEAKKKGT
jgi:tetratricopeptide (TPR) repeat protein